MLFRLVFAIGILWSSNCLAWQQNMKGSFDYNSFYEAFKTEDTILFNREMEALRLYDGFERDAFYGALLMKKSKSLPTIKRKLDGFRDGRDLLENSILKDPNNPEFRFLRLATQENAPSFLNYNDKKDEDASFLISTFKQIPPVVQKHILEYAKVSEVLKPEDFR